MSRTLPTGPRPPIRGGVPDPGYAAAMAYDEALAERVRTVLGDAPDVVAKRMFGGIAFMVAGNMACGVMGEDLLVRVGKAGQAASLARPSVRPMELSGRVMGGFVVVDAEGLDEDEVLAGWVERGSAFAASLPPK
jgi:TfoX/Sxy family transcriptional regulator of competence genes